MYWWLVNGAMHHPKYIDIFLNLILEKLIYRKHIYSVIFLHKLLFMQLKNLNSIMYKALEFKTLWWNILRH